MSHPLFGIGPPPFIHNRLHPVNTLNDTQDGFVYNWHDYFSCTIIKRDMTEAYELDMKDFEKTGRVDWLYTSDRKLVKTTNQIVQTQFHIDMIFKVSKRCRIYNGDDFIGELGETYIHSPDGVTKGSYSLKELHEMCLTNATIHVVCEVVHEDVITFINPLALSLY